MNLGLLHRAWRELWPATLLLGLIVAAFEGILAYVLPSVQARVAGQLAQLEFFRSVVGAMLGAEIEGEIGPGVFLSICWAHPVVLAAAWAHAVVSCTRVPAGEVDRGTIDVLMGLPVSRWEVWVSETVVWLGATVVLVLAATAGHLVGSLGAPAEMRWPIGRLAIVVCNLLCLQIAVGGLTCLVSALSDRRGRAITVVFIVLLASFLLNYLAQFWKPADKVSFLSLLSYHRPYFVLQGRGWPVGDMAVLAVAGAGLWTAGGVIFSRRDLSAL